MILGNVRSRSTKCTRKHMSRKFFQMAGEGLVPAKLGNRKVYDADRGRCRVWRAWTAHSYRPGMVPQANPGKVKAIIAVEPTGNSSLRGDSAPGSPCGLSDECLEFSPPIQGSSDLDLVRTSSHVAGLQSCWLQREHAPRTLSGLTGIPILIATGEASYHAQCDHCTSAFLNQAGVPRHHGRPC